MKWKYFLAVLAIIGCNNSPQKKLVNVIESAPQDSTADAKLFAEVTTPGPMQAMLARCVGRWQQERKYRHVAGDELMVDSLTVENRMILGGRFLQSTETGVVGGEPYEGIGLLGFDNLKKIFVATWLENEMTGIIYFEGSYDSIANAIILKGQYANYLGKKIDVRQTFQIDSNQYENDWYGSQPGEMETKHIMKKMIKVASR